MSKFFRWNAALVLLGIASAASAWAQTGDTPSENGHVIVGMSYQHDVSLPLYYLPEWNGEKADEGREAAENWSIPNRHVDSVDPVIQHTMNSVQAMPGTDLDFDGIPFPGVGCNCAPPDTNGEVGDTQYMQMVNEGFQIFDKTTGASLVGPTDISAVWAGFGGVCETSGHGDPVVLYDQMAHRWLISQFAGASTITDECVAVSTSDDATGSYNRYGFHLGTNFFDYPHLSVWPDGYYMSMNVFNSSGTAYLGPQPFVFDRNAMINGNPATFISTGLLGSSHAPILPADLDGDTLPPSGAPNTFVEFPESGNYNVYHFHTDWTTPANSTFTQFANPAAAGFSSICPGNRACVPQLGGTGGNGLDAIGDRLMYRLAYRNFGDHESLVGNYTVSASSIAAVRWFEMRGVTSGPVTVYQESTYQPDTTWRWMGSIAMDSAGNIALGYSASSASINPQIRYAGRLSTDPLNQLPQAEAHLFDGTGSQNGTGNRWGDYSAMTVDPVDDCTFWYTQEYYASTGSFNWRTRIGSFKYSECGTPGFTLAATPSSVSVCAGTPAVYTVNAGQISGFDSPVSLVASGNPGSTTAAFSPNPIPSLPGSSTLTIGSTGAAAAGDYTITINGTASGADPKSTMVDLTVYSAAPGAPTLTAPANGAVDQQLTPNFSWTGTAASFTLDIATDPGFSNIVFTGDFTGTSVQPSVTLQPVTQYFWRVTADNTCGTSPASSTFSFTTQDLSFPPTETFDELTAPALPGGFATTTFEAGEPWVTQTTSVDTAPNAAFTPSHATTGSAELVTNVVGGSTYTTLTFRHHFNTEQNWDGGVLEISIDGGAFQDLVAAGGSFSAGGYNGTLGDFSGCAGDSNPLANRDAWTGSQASFGTVTAQLPAASIGHDVQFRWRLGSDCSVSPTGAGWWVDSIQLSGGGTTTHQVTPSVGTPSGTISPSTPQTVADGATKQFTLNPATGFAIDNVGGTCGGSLAGNVFTTSPVTADCTVIANFAPAGFDVGISIDDGRDYAGYGMTMSYTITVTNTASIPAVGVSISNTLPAGLDESQATWVCSGGSGAICTASGSGAVSDSGVTVPANGSLTYTLTVPVRTDAAGGNIVNQVSLSAPSDTNPGNNTASDDDTLVIFRGGFESGNDGANAATPPAGR